MVAAHHPSVIPIYCKGLGEEGGGVGLGWDKNPSQDQYFREDSLQRVGQEGKQ